MSDLSCSFQDCESPRRGSNQRYCLSHHAAATREFRNIHPISADQRAKLNARTYLHVYVKRGLIRKGLCYVCGSGEKIEGHHADHSKPLSVTWLCRIHHIMLTHLRLSLLPRESNE